MTTPTDKPLSRKWKKFCDEYLANGMNATEAARSVGYKGENVKITAYKLLKKPEISAYIEEKCSAAEIPLGPIIQKFLEIANGEADGKILKSADQVAALDKLMRYKGAYRDKVETSGTGFQPVINFFGKKSDDE